METTLIIDKAKVYEEIAQTTSYTGTKMQNDPDAYKRIFTTDADQSQLERFWSESCIIVCQTLKKYLVSDKETDGGHEFEMEFSKSFDAALLPSMRDELFSFFVMNITAKWYAYSNKEEAPQYAATALSLIEGVHRKACYKRRPVRPNHK